MHVWSLYYFFSFFSCIVTVICVWWRAQRLVAIDWLTTGYSYCSVVLATQTTPLLKVQSFYHFSIKKVRLKMIVTTTREVAVWSMISTLMCSTWVLFLAAWRGTQKGKKKKEKRKEQERDVKIYILVMQIWGVIVLIIYCLRRLWFVQKLWCLTPSTPKYGWYGTKETQKV